MRCIDLFAGAGGFSTGAAMAGLTPVWAANHWPAAVEIHARNHPAAAHVCQDLHQADWSRVPAHDVLLASPCCQGHSRARGKANGNPQHDASRSTAWSLFPAWRMAIEALGYTLAPHVVDAADHGVPQHRRRLFVVATRSRHPIELQLPRRPHRAAAEAICLTSGKWSPIERPGRSSRTLARIAAGRRAHGDRFLAPYYGSGSGETGRSLQRPIGTLTTRARWALVDGDRMRMVTAAEGRALMGFPEGYQLPANEATAWHLIGNAVAPVQAADIINAIREAA